MHIADALNLFHCTAKLFVLSAKCLKRYKNAFEVDFEVSVVIPFTVSSLRHTIFHSSV